MKSKIFKSYIITFLSGLLFSCGPQAIDVEDQIQDYIKAPSYSKIEQGVFLTADTSISSVSYEGPILIWKNDIKPEQVKEVLNFKDQTMELDLAYKREAFKVDYLRQEKSKLEQGILAAKEQIAKNDLNQFYQDRDSQLELEAGWLKEQALSDQQKQDFEKYCQAMIWKFATSDTLKNYLFSVRPSPLGICESYYAEAGFFSGPECQTSSEGKEKDFFSCFWSETGTLKTDVSFYDGIGDLLQADAVTELKQAIKQQVSQNKNLLKFSAIKDGSLFVEFNGESELWLSFDRSEIIEFKDFIGDIIKQQFGVKSSSELGKQLKELLLERSNDLNSVQQYNFNDRVLNLPFSAPIDPKTGFRISPDDINALNTLATTTPELFGPKLAKRVISLLKEQNDLIVSLKDQIEPIETLLKIYQTPIGAEEVVDGSESQGEVDSFGIGLDLFRKKEAWENKRVESAKYVIGEDMVKALWAYSKVDFIKKGNILSITFFIDSKARETVPLQACFDTAQNIQVDCGGLSLSSTHAKMKITIEDPSTGILNLEITKPEYESVFLAPATRQEDEPLYQEEDLDREMLMGKTIKLEVMAGLYQHELPVLTGKAFIYDAENKMYEGTVSLTKAVPNL